MNKSWGEISFLTAGDIKETAFSDLREEREMSSCWECQWEKVRYKQQDRSEAMPVISAF